jgi:cell division protease FtsH
MPVAALITVGLLLLPGMTTPGVTSLSYTDFTSKVADGDVASVTIDDTGGVTGTLTDKSRFSTQVPTALDNAGLTRQLKAKGVEITAVAAKTPWWTALVAWLPLVFILGLLVWSGRATQRAMAGGIGGLGGFGRSRAKIIEAERPTTRFEDVAGYDGVKQEVGEVVDFLRHPERYAAAGAKGRAGWSWSDHPAPARR